MKLKGLLVMLAVFISSGSFLPKAFGQEVNIFAGGMISGNGEGSWAVQTEYKQLGLLGNKEVFFDGSFSYLNEGHTRNHRDGVIAQGWVRIPVSPKLSVSMGVGPYFYNNGEVGGPSTNGFGLVASVDAKYFVRKNFSVGVRINETMVRGGLDMTSFLFEVGYFPSVTPAAESKERKNQIMILLPGFPAKLSEIRIFETLADHIEVTAVNFFSGAAFKEKGIAVEVCLTNVFGNFKVGICAGPYYDLQDNEMAGIASLIGEYSFIGTPWSAVAAFDRSSNLGYNPDDSRRGIDAFSLGIGYKF